MELDFYSINSLKTMEVIDIGSGAKIGYIKDFKVDTEQCRILSILLPSQKVSLFSKDSDIEIPWDKIKKIGVDVILVDGEDIIDVKE